MEEYWGYLNLLTSRVARVDPKMLLTEKATQSTAPQTTGFPKML